MTLETVFDTLKREHQSQQPHHPQPLPATVGLTPAFRNAAQASPAYLEDLHIRLMSSGFAKVCLGDVLNIRVRIAEDKTRLDGLWMQSEGGFVHQRERPKGNLFEVLDFRTMHSARADMPQLSSFDNHNLPPDDADDSIDSAIDIKAVLDLEDVLDDNDGNMTAEDPSIEQIMNQHILPDVQPSTSWFSLEAFVGSSEMTVDWIGGSGGEWAVSADILERIDSDASQNMSMCSIFDNTIPESEVLALMGFGYVKSSTTANNTLATNSVPNSPCNERRKNDSSIRVPDVLHALPKDPELTLKHKKVGPIHINDAFYQIPTTISNATPSNEEVSIVLHAYRTAFSKIAENLEKHGSAFDPSARIAEENSIPSSFDELHASHNIHTQVTASCSEHKSNQLRGLKFLKSKENTL